MADAGRQTSKDHPVSVTNIFGFIPTYRDAIKGVTFDSTHTLSSTLLSKGIGIAWGRYSWFDIAEIRNVALTYWYDIMPDSTHLLFVDDDIGFPAACVLDMLTFGEPVVGAIYRKKTFEYDWAASGLPPGEAEFRGRAFLEVEGLGAGLLLIRRDAVTTMMEKFPELIRPHMTIGDFARCERTIGLFDHLMSEKGKVSEDISFCRRWRQAGGKVWANTSHEITHVGDIEFRGCYARWKMEQDAAGKIAEDGQSAA